MPAMGMLALARIAGHAALAVLLPARCLTCDAPVDTPGQLCPPCFNATSFVIDPCCIRCGQGFAHAGEGGLAMQCQPCTANPPAWRQARAALQYDGQAGRIILPFKHGDRVETARALGRHMARAGAALLREADILVPVPLHPRRMRARRYNQSALLAQAVARLSGRPVALDALRRVRATRSLQGQSAADRAAEVAGAFAVTPARLARIAGARVLLVDDVLTSGATANGCARTLLAAGAAAVDVLVAARVPWRAAD
jgi:ComF family protein